MLYTKRALAVLVTLFLLAPGDAFAQKNAEISTDIHTFDFGIISEADGLASHVFKVKNTGADPLVITRITASCGCTRPDWSKAPIEAGKTGEVKISYNPKGRPGPFYKSIAIHSNARNGRLNLYVKGNVMPKAKIVQAPAIVYPYSIGDLRLQSKSVLYNSLRPGEISEEKIPIRNDGPMPLRIRLGKTPGYLKASVSHERLQPGDTALVRVVFHTDAARRMGRVSTELPVTIAYEGKKKDTDGAIRIAANVINNFSKMTAAERAQAPAITFSSTQLDFGKLPEKGGGIIPFIGGSGKESETFTITNTGKSNLSLYSVTCDHDVVDISGGKKELKPGASAEYKVTIRSKDVKAKLETFINVVCDDPNNPVRLIKITAEK